MGRWRQLGLSLIEVVVAIGIFMLGAVAILNLFPWAMHNVGRSQAVTIGTLLCQQKTEEILAGRYDDPAPADGTFPAHPGFFYHVEKTPYGASEHLKTVKVQVTYDGAGGRVLAAEDDTLQGGVVPGGMTTVTFTTLTGNYNVVSGAQSNSYLLFSDPRTKTIYWRPTVGFDVPMMASQNSQFYPLMQWATGASTTLPDEGVPTTLTVTTAIGGGPINSFFPRLFVYDAKNKCMWTASLREIQTGFGPQIGMSSQWTKIELQTQ